MSLPRRPTFDRVALDAKADGGAGPRSHRLLPTLIMWPSTFE